jgi:hypothetical protein
MAARGRGIAAVHRLLGGRPVREESASSHVLGVGADLDLMTVMALPELVSNQGVALQQHLR